MRLTIAERLALLPEGERRRRAAIKDAARRRRAGDAFIYVASWAPGFVKIGIALDPSSRMKTLKIDARLSETPRLLASMPGTILQEQALHHTLRRALWKSSQGPACEVYPTSILAHPEMPEALRVSA